MKFDCKTGQITTKTYTTSPHGVESGNLIIRSTESDGDILFYGNDGGTDTLLLTMDSSVPSIKPAVDVAFQDDISLLDGKKVILGTGSDGEIYSSSDDIYIKNVTSDKDIAFYVNDGGSSKNLLLLDASAPNVVIPLDDAKLVLGAGSDAELYVNTDDLYIRNVNEDNNIIFSLNVGSSQTTVLTLLGASGQASFADNVLLADGKKLKLGTGLDGEIYSSSDDLYIANVTSDKDIIFSVNDGGSQTTVLTLNSDVPSIDLAANLVLGDALTAGFTGAAALGTHAATTNTDKTGNAKSGTIKVIFNGTTYHIQLYADS